MRKEMEIVCNHLILRCVAGRDCVVGRLMNLTPFFGFLSCLPLQRLSVNLELKGTYFSEHFFFFSEQTLELSHVQLYCIASVL